MTYFIVIFILIATITGLPLFLGILSGTLLAFNREDWQSPIVFIEMIRLMDAPVLMAIPLFTFTGFMLSKSNAPKRLVMITEILFGWLPGGLCFVALIACAVLTAFTGASGVTIIALGSLLYPSLLQQGYSKPFTLGLLTTGGSRGLLFPPSLPLILYPIIIKENIDQFFKACFIPGCLAIASMAIYCFFVAKKLPLTPTKNEKYNSLSSLKHAWFEIPLPFIILGGIYSGFFTVNEAAGIGALYVFIVEVLILGEINLKRDFFPIVLDSMVLVSTILIILSCALGFTSFLVDQQIPTMILEYIRETIKHPLIFLIALNLILLMAGCVMDVFSALIILVPLIHPVAMEMGIHPLHLGVIFLTNLEIGYSTPPIGINLFISKNNFGAPLIEIYKSTLPFLGIQIIVLILVTYIPYLSLCLIN